MNKEDISELLAVAYACHYSDCKSKGIEAVAADQFHEIYKNNIQEFRHLMNVDEGRELNG